MAEQRECEEDEDEDEEMNLDDRVYNEPMVAITASLSLSVTDTVCYTITVVTG